MKIKQLLILTFLLVSTKAFTQVTRIQFINNCPDLSIQGIDIYIDGMQIYDNLLFRQSTPYIDLNTSSLTEIGIGDLGSLTVADTFVSRTTALSFTNIYVIVINGVKSTTGYTPYKKASIDIYNMGQEATSVGQTGVLFLNGCTDAPVMDIRTGITTMADDIEYGEFSNTYTQLSALVNHNFRITNGKGNVTTHNYNADLPAMSTSGKGVVVVASGFLNPANNSNGENFGLWVSHPTGGAMTQLDTANAEQLARVQLIHNSADTAVGKVDVYVNNQKYFDTLDYRHATAYLDVFSDVTLNVGFAKAGSGIQFYNTTLTLDSGKTYAAVLHGIESDTNYKPLAPLTLSIYNNAKEDAVIANNVDVLMMHGSTDGPAIRANDFFNAPVVMNLSYGNFSTGYSPMFATPLALLRVDTGVTFKHLAKYEIKVTDWNLLGKTTTILASGFANPDSNSGGPKLGFWAALPEGGALRELPVYVSVDEVSQKATTLTVWPNPATSTLHFATNGEKNNLIVTDVTGKVILKENNTTNKFISIRNLENGNYLLFVQNEAGEVAYSKFTKL